MRWRAAVAALLLTGCASLRPAMLDHRRRADVDRGFEAYLDGRVDAAATLLASAPSDALAIAGRALIAHERGDWDRAWPLWIDLLKLPAGDWWPALAELAAHKIEALVEERPAAAAASSELRRLDLGRLPLEARRRLQSVLAAYARRAGDERAGRELDRAAGCPDLWLEAGPVGTLPHLDLERAGPIEREQPTALMPVPTRACSVTLEAHSGRPGVLYAIGWWRAGENGQATVIVDTDGPWRLLVDGVSVFSQLDERRYQQRRQTLAVALLPGWHQLAVKVAAPGGRAVLEAAVLGMAEWSGQSKPPRRGPVGVRPVPFTRAPLARGALGLFGKYLDAHAALRHRDGDAGEELLEAVLAHAPRFAPGLLLAAQLALDDPSRPSELAQDRSRRALERALALDPALLRARYNLAGIDLQLERPREALERLAAGPPPPTPSWRIAYVRSRAWKGRGFAFESDQALDEARRLNPEACLPLIADLERNRERHDLTRALELARAARTCDGGRDEYADLLTQLQQYPAAVAELHRLLTIDPGRELTRAHLGETFAEWGKLSEAARVFGELVRRYPRAPHYRQRLADTLVALGERGRARAILEAGLAETPESMELRRALAALCDLAGRACEGMVDRYRVDGKQVIAEFERHGHPYATPAVLVLDRTVTRVFPTGARLTLTHNIIKVLGKDGIDKFGEVRIPEGADVLTLRTVKADGTTREPEEISEKDTVSAPDLEPGDYVELEYVEAAAPPAAFVSGFDSERFYFRSFDAPLDRTEALVVAPKSMKLMIDVRGREPGVPEERTTSMGELEIRSFAARAQPQLLAEPHAAPFAEYVPSVRVASQISFEAWRDYLIDEQSGALRSNRELRRVAADVTRGVARGSRLEALDRWVRQHVQHGGALDEPAAWILARRQGNRVTLLAALCLAAGMDPELWLARSIRAAELEGGLPDLEAFDQPLLSVGGRVIDPRFRHSPTGFLIPQLRGARALVLRPGAVRFAITPAVSTDNRRVEMEAELGANGAAEVRVRERLRGFPALEWREGLEKLGAERVRPEFEERTLGYYFPGASLQKLEASGKDEDSGELTVEYRFHAPTFARPTGAQLAVPAPFAALLQRRYVGGAVRRAPLEVELVPPSELVLHLRLPTGARPELPPEVKASGFGSFQQSVRRSGAELVLESRFTMPETRVPVERYPEFVDFALAVDRAEATAFRLTLGK